MSSFGESARRLKRIAIVLGVLGATLVVWGCRAAPRPLNILLIVADTTRADHLGSYGYARDTTPNIDRLAAGAAVFEQAYSHSPWTMPSVASILTSLPPLDHGIVTWAQPLPAEHLTLAEHLRMHSFRTAAFVSHIIFEPRYGFDQGFTTYDDSVLTKGNPAKVSSSQEISDHAIEWLQAQEDGPFFAWLHYFDPHEGYRHHEDHHFGSKVIDYYDSEIAFMDRHIGRVLEALEQLDLADETIVVFVADHGEEFEDHGGVRHSRTLYDEVVRIPLVIRVPAFGPQRIRSVVSESDLAPALCRLANVPVPQEFSGKPFGFDASGFRIEPGRTVVMETLRHANKRGVRHERWKLIHDRRVDLVELFDMRADPKEQVNLVDRHPRIAEFLRQAMDDHYRKGRTLAEEQELPQRVREQLEALGYVQ